MICTFIYVQLYIYVYVYIYIDYIYIHVTKYPATTRIRIPTPLIQLRLVTQAPFQATPSSRMHQLGRRRGTDGANINVPTGGIIPELREVAGWLDTSLVFAKKWHLWLEKMGIFEGYFLGLPEKYIFS